MLLGYRFPFSILQLTKLQRFSNGLQTRFLARISQRVLILIEVYNKVKWGEKNYGKNITNRKQVSQHILRKVK